MTKGIAQLPSDVQKQVRALEALPEGQIDTTHAPEILDWTDARRGVFLSPRRSSKSPRDAAHASSSNLTGR